MSGILSGLLGGFANINHADPAGGSNPMTLLWQQYLLNQQRQRMQEVPPGQPGAALGVDPNAPQGMPALRAWLQSLHDDTDSFSDDTYAHIRDAMVLAGSGSDPQALQAALEKANASMQADMQAGAGDGEDDDAPAPTMAMLGGNQ